MFILFITPETETRATVHGIHYKPELLTPEERAGGFEVDYVLSNPEEIKGKVAVHYFNPVTSEQWYEYVDRPLTQDEIIDNLQQYVVTLEKMIIDTYKPWKEAIPLEKDEVINYKQTLYKVVIGHTTQADWIPPLVPNLFVLWSDSDNPREWVQPAGAHDSYDIGEKAIYLGKNYISKVYNNIWNPTNSTYWKEVDENWNDIPEPEIAPWTALNPDGSNKLYMTGDKVLFEGSVYESKIDNNSWSPTAYPQGWTLIP